MRRDENNVAFTEGLRFDVDDTFAVADIVKLRDGRTLRLLGCSGPENTSERSADLVAFEDASREDGSFVSRVNVGRVEAADFHGNLSFA